MGESDSTRRGLKAVLLATAVAGVVGYVIQLLAPALLDSDAAYVSFSIFWSTVYLGGAAISGVQQEVARTVHPAESGGGGRVLRRFTLVAVLIVLAAAIVVSQTLGSQIIPDSGVFVGGALGIAFVGYLLTAVLNGIFYGLHLWRAVAFIVIADAVLRALLVVAGLALGWDVAVLALLIALPFGLTAAASWMIFRHRVIRSFTLDVGLQRLSAQTTSLVIAASASGVMISGLPMIIGLTSAAAPAAVTGALLLAITVTRAPIVIPVIALQSFLIAAVFRRGGVHPGRLIRLVAVAIAAGAALAVIGWFAGPPLIGWLSGSRFVLPAEDAAAIVFSAALVAALCVTGPALVSIGRHGANVLGWTFAAILTVVLLLMPTGENRVLIALVVPPALGLAIHITALLRERKAGAAGFGAPEGPILNV